MKSPKSKPAKFHLIAPVKDLFGDPVQRELGDGRKIDMTLRHLVRQALDQPVPGESKHEALRRGDLVAALAGVAPVALERDEIKMILEMVARTWAPMILLEVGRHLDSQLDQGKARRQDPPRYDVDDPILNLDDEPEEREMSSGGKIVLTVRLAAQIALNAAPPAGAERTNGEWAHRARLIGAMQADGPVPLDSDDVVMIEGCVHRAAQPSHLRAVRAALSRSLPDAAQARA